MSKYKKLYKSTKALEDVLDSSSEVFLFWRDCFKNSNKSFFLSPWRTNFFLDLLNVPDVAGAWEIGYLSVWITILEIEKLSRKSSILIYLWVTKGKSSINIVNYVLGMKEFVPSLDVPISNNNIILLSKAPLQDLGDFVFLLKIEINNEFLVIIVNFEDSGKIFNNTIKIIKKILGIRLIRFYQ